MLTGTLKLNSTMNILLINLEMKLPIYDMLDLSPNANQNRNYEVLAEQQEIAKSVHMTKKIKRFNKRKHKKMDE